MFDEQDVHFEHHVHGLEQIFREIPLFQKERVETVVQIVLEELQRTGFRQDAAHDLFMTVQDFVERIRREVIARLQVEKLAERKSSQVV